MLRGEQGNLCLLLHRRIRYRVVNQPGLGGAHARAARELSEQLTAGQATFTLQRGDLLLLNQHRCVHGREPLGDGQRDVAPDDRRLLLQLFLRDTGRPS